MARAVCRSAEDRRKCRNHLQCLVGYDPGRQAFDPARRLCRSAGPGARDRRAPRGLTVRIARRARECSSEQIGSCSTYRGRNRIDQAGCRGRGQLHAVRYLRFTCARAGRQPFGLRDVRHQEAPCPHGTQSEDGRDLGDLRLHRGDLQGRQAFEGCRERRRVLIGVTGNRGQARTRGAA